MNKISFFKDQTQFKSFIPLEDELAKIKRFEKIKIYYLCPL